MSDWLAVMAVVLVGVIATLAAALLVARRREHDRSSRDSTRQKEARFAMLSRLRRPRKDAAAVDVTVGRAAKTASAPPAPTAGNSDELLALLHEPTRPAVLATDRDGVAAVLDLEPEPARLPAVTELPRYIGQAKWVTAQRSHQGYRRERNEDAVHTSPDLVAIADGVGGGPAGGPAARIVLRTIGTVLQDPVVDESDLRTAVAQASAALYGASLIDKRLRGMATTLDIAVLGLPASGSAQVRGAHVGDAAVWQITPDERPRLLTKPHRTAEGALTHAVGDSLRTYCEIWDARLRVGDRLVLATDGFHGQLAKDVADRGLAEVRGMSADDAADFLVATALGGGGQDNVSVVVVDLVPDGKSATRSAVDRAGKRRRISLRRRRGPVGSDQQRPDVAD
jgi:protein phosphatase